MNGLFWIRSLVRWLSVGGEFFVAKDLKTRDVILGFKVQVEMAKYIRQHEDSFHDIIIIMTDGIISPYHKLSTLLLLLLLYRNLQSDDEKGRAFFRFPKPIMMRVMTWECDTRILKTP